MILTGMLFLLGLSSDLVERKMILYLSAVPFLFFIATSIIILSNRSIITIKIWTGSSLGFLFIVIFLVIVDVVFFDNEISNYFENITNENDNNNTDTNSINDNNNFDNISKITNNITNVKL